MEASGAGQGQAQGGDAGQGQQDSGTADLTARFDQIAGSIGEMKQYLQSQPWQQQADGQPDTGNEDQQDDGLDLSFLNGQFGDQQGYDQMDPQQTAQQLHDAMQQAIDKAVTAKVTPMEQAMEEQRLMREGDYLLAEFPELGDENVQKQTVQVAQELAQNMSRPELAREPAFIRLAYLASRAADAANTEGRDAPSAAHLEGGAGATQGGSSQVDLANEIVAARGGGANALPFH